MAPEEIIIEKIAPYVKSMDWEGYEIKIYIDGKGEIADNYHHVINVSESKTTEVWLNGFPRQLLSEKTVITAHCKNVGIFKAFMKKYREP